MSERPLSIRARIARLNALIPEDPDRLCCLEGFVAYQETVAPWLEGLGPRLDLGDPDPPLDPPELPLGGVCRKTGEPLCPLAAELAALIWKRRRSVAISFAGLSEEDL